MDLSAPLAFYQLTLPEVVPLYSRYYVIHKYSIAFAGLGNSPQDIGGNKSWTRHTVRSIEVEL